MVIAGQPVDTKPWCLADEVPVVLVHTRTGSWGSGVVVDQTEGVVLTCSHVVKSESQGTAFCILCTGTAYCSQQCCASYFKK